MVSSKGSGSGGAHEVERVQTGVRMEKRILKVLKALAELHDMSLGDLLEGIVLHAFEGKPPFSAKTLGQVAELKRIYGLDLDAAARHNLKETARRARGSAGPRASRRAPPLSRPPRRP
jgi:hypothetical protein